MARKLYHIARLVLVLSVLLSTQSLIMVQVAFKVRQDYIIERLCVNRDRPEMNCDGFCQLTKMMQEKHDQEQQDRAAVLELLISSVHAMLPVTGFLVAPPIKRPDYAPFIAGSPAQGALADVFVPPRSV